MQIIPFSTQTVELRVLNSKIGKVVPIVDIAKVIDYDLKALKQLLERNDELFDGAMITVTTLSAHSQKSVNGNEYKRTQKQHVKALNSYGVYGLLMKLSYNRIQNEEKKQTVIRFQRWAMETLASLDNSYPKRPVKRNARLSQRAIRGTFIDNDPLPPKGLETIDYKEAAEMIGVSTRTLRRYVLLGFITRYNGARYGLAETKRVAEKIGKKR